MNSKKRFALLTFFIIATLFMAIGGGYTTKQDLPPKTYGIPQVITNQVVLADGHISQILDDGHYMYVMVDNHLGYIQVYDLTGTYQFTLSFYYTLNGAFRMALDSDTLYVCDTGKNLYTFQNGRFLSFIKKVDATEIMECLDFDDFSERYEIRMGSVWRVDKQEAICVIQRSTAAFIHQYYLDWLLIIIFMFLIILLMKPKGRRDGSVVSI